jgi:hypothetical protein
MKKIVFSTLIGLLCSSLANAQFTAYNPFTQNIHFSPEPTAAGFECNSIQSVEFIQGLTTKDDANNWENTPLTVTICVTGFKYNGPASTAVTGSYAANFDWEYDSFAPSCVVGTQNRPLKGTGNDPLNPDPASSGLIKLSLLVPETSPKSTVLAVNVNLQVPGYMAQFNSSPDDNESTQTQTFCNLRIKGNVFYDKTLTNNVVDGTPIATPATQQLYANLVGNDGLVIATQAISTDGKYEFLSINEQTAYTVVLSTILGTAGNPAPLANLPANWINVGESTPKFKDPTPNGLIGINVIKASIIDINFGIYTAAPLPLKLKYFYVSENQCKANLNWASSQELNVRQTDVLRKQGANNQFRKVATILANGNSNDEKTYSFIDEFVEKSDATYEYQLRFEDIDGQESFSDVKSLKMTCEEGVVSTYVYPNPSVGKTTTLFYITESANETLLIQVLDLTGRKLFETTSAVHTGTTEIVLNTSEIPTGQYFVKYQELESEKEGNLKFWKN